MKMSKSELKDFLHQYGNTRMGRYIKEQLNKETVKEPDEQVPAGCKPTKRKLSVMLILFKTAIVAVGLVILAVRPVVGLLLFVLAACISKWRCEK